MSSQPSRSRTPSRAPSRDALADAWRRWGYLCADVDPLGRLEPEVHPELAEARATADPEADERWRALYGASIGVEFMHLRDRERVEWLREQFEAGPPEVDRRWLFERLVETEVFERFLHARYVGAKRFSIDGIAALIPLTDAVLDAAAEAGARFLYLGMSHRGRLNVMRNIANVPLDRMFAGMEDVDPRSVLGAGDVKYHLGATGRYVTRGGREIEVHLGTNPSHLEAVDPVLMGRVRARQERWGEDGVDVMLPVCMHGDAAFAGQGVASETLNLADLPGYSVGGTVQIIVNNLLGFTAEPPALHSTRYASDAARRLMVPILHVNGEDPDAVWWAGVLAARYRYRFRSDVVIDLVGFRRYGHSEVEDPTTTQPRLYARIREHPFLYEIYARRIGVPEDEVETRRRETMERMSAGQEAGRSHSRRPVFFTLPSFWGRYHGGRYDPQCEVETAVDAPRIARLAEAIASVPDGFHVHPKVARMLEQRRAMARGERPVDWGMAEALAFASLLDEGVCVRLAGQDSRRGTFNHRHAALVDVETGEAYVPLTRVGRDGARFDVIDSPLSEAAALGFEYGYSRERPDGLVCWEAQFGDFANGAQIIIDQYITAAEDKWNLLSGLVLLLPHGYEGQGPEHSSARIERFLQLAAQDNIQVVQPSNSAQYFHLLRRQVLRTWRKPLVVFTPKSMLRAQAACSPLEALTSGAFQPVIPDTEVPDPRVILLCSGKVAHELRAERRRREAWDRAIVTIEQFYPFPERPLRDLIRGCTSAERIIWVQEEPANMGALSFLREKLRPIAGDRHLSSIKRYESASPATGSAKAHALEQQMLVRLAFA